ncbi:MAG: histidinol-phosphate transaminase [Mariprofundaceae bacterium]|nr:histidinol-phosphate transaminase [Mariprofundaceae bacterium]
MIRKDIRALSSYHVADASGMIKLDAMENPFTLPPSLRTAWQAVVSEVDINRYPDSEMHGLRAQIAMRDRVIPEQVLLGNGSDEIIQMLLLATGSGTVMTPAPSFVMYEMVAKWLQRSFFTLPLGKNFALDAEQFLSACAREKVTLVFLACPNNPTGNMWEREALQTICHRFNGLIIIDEAYAPFASRTHTDLLAPNVMILRTFSKYGWAGLRLGYLLGSVSFIHELNKVRMPYNINSLTQASASFLLQHDDLFQMQARMICNERKRVSDALKELPGIHVFPSEANFLLLRVADASMVFEQLKRENILIKNMHGSDPALQQCLRITIGTEGENKQLLAAMRRIYHG